MTTETKANLDDMLTRYYAAKGSLERFGKHPANTEIRAELTREADSARADLESHGYRFPA